MNLDRPWSEFQFVAFDTETSGAYPLDSEIVEFGAVKWSAKTGQNVAEYQTLLKPSRPMSDFIIKIHGISNEMVQDAPSMKDKISEIQNFFSDSVLVAHHAPFDMGFMAADFEKFTAGVPDQPVLCTSLLARKLIRGTTNHKLQTLVKELNLKQSDGHQAHRALDDAQSCLEVLKECFKRVPSGQSLLDFAKNMNGFLQWKNFKLTFDQDANSARSGDPSQIQLIQKIKSSIQAGMDLNFIYLKDSSKQSQIPRAMTPVGIVRGPDGDFVVGRCHNDGTQKRFYLSKVRLLDESLP